MRVASLLGLAVVISTGCGKKEAAPDRPRVVTREDGHAAEQIMTRRPVPAGVNKDWLLLDLTNVVHVRSALPPRGDASEGMQSLGSRWDHEGDEIGFGLRLSTAQLTGGMTTCKTTALVFDHRIAELETRCAGSSDSWPGIEAFLVDAAGPGARVDGHALAFRFSEPDVAGRARAAVARELGPTAAVDVPPELAKAYDDLLSPLHELVFGSSCGEVGEPPAGRSDIRKLVASKRFDLVANVARGPNPSGRVYAAEALLARGEPPSPADAATIAKIQALPLLIPTCAGCTGGGEAPASEVLRPKAPAP